MMQTKYWFLLLLLLLPTKWVIGQTVGNDTAIKGSVIEVIQSYKPQVRQAPKPEWIPQLPPPDTFHRVFSYIVPQQPLYYSYHSDPLKPLALGKDTVAKPLPNYVKAGGGNLSTLYLDAGIGSFATPDYETYFHVHHISQNGNIKYQQTALSGIETEGFWHKNNNEWHATLNGERNQYYYYGYNHDMYNYNNTDSLKQTFTSIKTIVDYKKKDIGDAKIDYHPVVTGSFFGAKFNTNETNFGFHVPFTYDIDTAYQAHLDIGDNFVIYSTDSPSVANNLFNISPGINFLSGAITGHADLGLAIGKDSHAFLLPDIEGSYIVPNTNFRVSGGWAAKVQQNTYEQLTNENPYIFNNYLLHQTRFDELFVNLLGNYNSLQFNGRLSWCNYKSLPTYLDTTGDHKQFSIVYDTVSALAIQVGARYLIANNYEIGLTANMYEYYEGTTQYPWHIPNLKIKGDFAIKPLPQLVITAYLSLLSGIHALDNLKKVVNLNTFTDIGGNAEYQINMHFYVFLQVSNLLNENYQRWLGYNAYGINIYGGLRLKF